MSNPLVSPTLEHRSLLARTAASNNASASSCSSSSSPAAAPLAPLSSSSIINGSGPSSAPNSHARAYLDAISPPARRLALQRTSSSVSYKPQKPSSLAASVAGSEHDDDDDEEDEDERQDDHEARRRRSQSSSRAGTSGFSGVSSSASSTSSASLRNSLAMSSSSSPPEDQSIASSTATTTAASTPPTIDVSSILSLLDDIHLDEEDKIERVRDRLGLWLEEIEGGVKPSPFRLDTVVLDLMHRHREDVNPTGASFPSSPLRRPGSARSFSSQNLHRPWTPSKTPSAASIQSGSDAPNAALSPTSSAHLGGVPAPPRSSSPAPTGPDPGVIGSGSPRGSPRFWNRAPAPLSISSTHRDSFDSTASIAGSSSSPWGGFNLLGSPSTTPASSSTAGSSSWLNAPSSPRSAVPPPGLPSTGTTASAASSSGTGLTTPAQTQSSSSRPTSPSPFNSPRLNVAAVAFKPRTPSASTSASSTAGSVLSSSAGTGAGTGAAISIPARRGDLAAPARRSSSQAILHKNHPVGADDEDEDDEFSPFAGAPAKADALVAPGSSYYSSSGGSSFGEAGGEMALAATAVAAGEEDETGLSGGAATPFDVLFSILSGAGASSSAGTAQWTPEQVEEALAAHSWDVEATLSAIVDAGGKPPAAGSARNSNLTAAATRSPRPPPTGPASWAGGATGRSSSGVSLMSRDVFSSIRGGAGGNGWSPSISSRSRPGGLTGSPALSNASPLASPQPSHSSAFASGGSGPVGPGRVCRYFLSGDCRRADCRFSHDLSKALCKFWLRGQCLNDPCPFLHDEGVLLALANGGAPGGGVTSDAGDKDGGRQSQQVDDFPELLPPSGPRAQRAASASMSGPPAGAPTGPAASDPTRSRWVNAVQRNASASSSTGPIASGITTPVAAMLAGSAPGSEGAIHLQARNAPVTRPPLGPRTASSTSSSAGPTSTAPSSKPPTRIPLHPPTLLPTLTHAAAHYTSHRSSLFPLIEQRNRCLARASEAFRSGDGAEARRWSAEGQALNREVASKSGTVARGIVRERMAEVRERLMGGGDAAGGGGGMGVGGSTEPAARGLKGRVLANGLALCLGVARKEALPTSAGGATLSAAERTEILVDLHGLHASEAVEIVEEVLLSLEEESEMRGLVYLAVGVGKHTSVATDKRRGTRVSAGVKGWLSGWGYPHVEWEGVVGVDGLSHW